MIIKLIDRVKPENMFKKLEAMSSLQKYGK